MEWTLESPRVYPVYWLSDESFLLLLAENSIPLAEINPAEITPGRDRVKTEVKVAVLVQGLNQAE